MFDGGAPAVADLDVPSFGWESGEEWAFAGGPDPVPDVDPAALPASSGLAMELEYGLPPLDRQDDAALLSTIASYGRVAAWAQANASRALAEFARRRAADPTKHIYAADEIAVELRLSTGTAQLQLDRAAALDEHLAPTRALWEQGLLDERRVAVIVDGTRHLPVEIAALVQAIVLPRAPRQTAAQLRAALRRAIIAADPEGAEARHQAAHAERAVQLWPDPDGMATLAAKMSAPDAVGCFEWLSRLARGLGAGDPRSMDARRSDLLVGLITGRIVAGAPGDAAGGAPEAASAGVGSGAGAATSGASERAPGAGSSGAGVSGADASAPPAHDAVGYGTSSAAAESSGAGGNGVRAFGASASAARAFGAGASGADASAPPAHGAVGFGPSSDAAQTSGVGTSAAGASGAVPSDADPSGAEVVGAEAPSAAPQVVRPVGPGKPAVQVVVDLDTLRGAAEHPAELAGYGPITAAQARAVAADAVWRRLVTDPLSGVVLDVGRTTYRPPAGLADLVRARDGSCRFPGCRRAASGCELDHVVPFPEGPTSDANLALGCGRHHHLKHDSDWRVAALPDGGLEWTSPTGSSYRTYPRDHRPLTGGRPPPGADPPPF